MAVLTSPTLTVPATVSAPTTNKNYGAPLGLYAVGALVVVSLADTKAAPVVAAFLLAAAIYNANYLLQDRKTVDQTRLFRLNTQPPPSSVGRDDARALLEYEQGKG